jgi:autotransporter-associated beta strand protein
VQITDALYTNTGDFIVGKTGASGALTLTTSTESVNPATLTVGGKLAVGVDSGSGTFVLNGGSSVTVTGSIVLGGRSDGSPAAATASGIVDIYGGTVTKENTPGTYMFLGSAGTGEWNQHGGATIIHAPTIFGDDGSITGTLNLNGGVYATSRIYTGVAGVGTAQGRINFDGGTLQADPTGFQFSSGNPFIFLRNAPDLVISVKQHGATIDTNGADITIPVGFTKDTASSGGGLTKIGGGVMALTGKSTYDGLTVIKEGTLQTRITFQTVYTAPNYPGNRTDGPFALGHDFTVNSPVQVTQLGVFDDLGDGILGTHAVHLTNLDDPLFDQIVTFDATTNETTTYSRGFRFATLGTPLSLAAGHYLLWVDSLGGDNDAFAQDICEFDSGNTGAIAMGTSWYDLTPGTMPQQPWGANDATVSFVFYDPASVTNAAILPSMTPVQLGGAVGSTPTLDLQGANQQIGSLADVAGAAVMGVVTNSLPIQPVVLTLAADSGTTTYSGSIEGNLSLVKTGGSTQILTGSLTYTGDTTVNEGTLIVNDLVMPGSTISVKDGATLEARSIVADTLSIGGAPSSGAASPIAVPEPCTLVLLTLAIAAMATCMARGRK